MLAANDSHAANVTAPYASHHAMQELCAIRTTCAGREAERKRWPAPSERCRPDGLRTALCAASCRAFQQV